MEPSAQARCLGNTFRKNADPRHCHLHKADIIKKTTRFVFVLRVEWSVLGGPMTSRKAALLCGMIALTGWGATFLGGDVQGVSEAASSSATSPAAAAAASHPNLPEVAVEATSPGSGPAPQPGPGMQLASVSTSKELNEDRSPVAGPIGAADGCLAVDTCIDAYLWSLYERAPKIDTNKVTEKIKATLKKKGKTLTVIKTVIKYVVGDFAWKDPSAAQKAGMSLKDYVIGGIDPGFKLKLYRALRAMDDAGFMPGITSAFRDNYRQSIASGNKAASDSSYHGGSRRGGYGHALAVDLVSVRGETRMERSASSEELWRWIDAHEQELGIGRPYLDKDPPHVAPIDGKEYADKRGRAKAQLAGLKRTSPSSNVK